MNEVNKKAISCVSATERLHTAISENHPKIIQASQFRFTLKLLMEISNHLDEDSLREKGIDVESLKKIVSK